MLPEEFKRGKDLLQISDIYAIYLLTRLIVLLIIILRSRNLLTDVLTDEMSRILPNRRQLITPMSETPSFVFLLSTYGVCKHLHGEILLVENI